MKALSADAMAAPVGRRPNLVVVSVADGQGQPVGGLAMGNFNVGPMIVGNSGSAASVAGVMPGRLPGSYHISIEPVGPDRWAKGIYFFTIAATAGADSGQTLATVLVN